MAFGAYATAELIHGNGFIAAFVAGLTFGNTLQRKCEYLYEFAESEGMILILLTFAAFGIVLLPDAIPQLSVPIVLFAVLSLTVVRMLPVSISLIGTGVTRRTGLFLGWFGPRGLASILFVLLILEKSAAPHRQTILIAVTVTVALSVLLHGASAGPAAARYGAATRTMGRCEENRPVSSTPFS
jgi:NhaP-type Na+/H+ or K+/H+ antiporter